jgi:hypothetical protein
VGGDVFQNRSKSINGFLELSLIGQRLGEKNSRRCAIQIRRLGLDELPKVGDTLIDLSLEDQLSSESKPCVRVVPYCFAQLDHGFAVIARRDEFRGEGGACAAVRPPFDDGPPQLHWRTVVCVSVDGSNREHGQDCDCGGGADAPVALLA